METPRRAGSSVAKGEQLDVSLIPTNRPLRRAENPDVVYRTATEKYEAVVNGILQEDNSYAFGLRQIHESGQPVLVGTISIEKSEHLANLLKKAGIPHQVLYAKQQKVLGKAAAPSHGLPGQAVEVFLRP